MRGHLLNASSLQIANLAEAKLLSMHQAVPSSAAGKSNAPNLDAEPVRGIVQHLHETGKLVLKGIVSRNQLELFRKTNNLTKRGIMSASSNSAFRQVAVALLQVPSSQVFCYLK